VSAPVAINGFGRIGRSAFRAAHERGDAVEIVAINDLTDAQTLAHLLRYDSVLGGFPGSVAVVDGDLEVDGRRIRVLSERDPARLPWAELDVKVVLESTGLFTQRDRAAGHLAAGARTVVISAPATEADVTVVLGVNDQDLQPGHQVISNASCTTNCLAPVAKVLHETIGIEHGLVTTIHAYTSDQRLQDAPHSDPRRARAAATNLIPTSTGAARAVGLVLPALAGRLHGMAIRAPVICGSVVDLTFEAARPTSAEEVNLMLSAAAGAESALDGILQYTEDPLVSGDVIGNPHSSILDAGLTSVIDERLVKVIAWYDNEWGYSNRCVDLLRKLTRESVPSGVGT
jgi:glyceraldehyde 3-phosphate dehydrogenase